MSNKQDELLKAAIRSSIKYENTTGTLRLDVFTRNKKWVIYSYKMPIAYWDNNNIYIVRSSDVPTTTTHKHRHKVVEATSHFGFVKEVSFDKLKKLIDDMRSFR